MLTAVAVAVGTTAAAAALGLGGSWSLLCATGRPSVRPSRPSTARICKRCHRFRIACSVRRGSRSAIRFHLWPNSRTLVEMIWSSSFVHDWRCSDGFSLRTRGGAAGLTPPAVVCCTKHNKTRTAEVM